MQRAQRTGLAAVDFHLVELHVALQLGRRREARQHAAALKRAVRAWWRDRFEIAGELVAMGLRTG
jgi:hypothetical protein